MHSSVQEVTHCITLSDPFQAFEDGQLSESRVCDISSKITFRILLIIMFHALMERFQLELFYLFFQSPTVEKYVK